MATTQEAWNESGEGPKPKPMGWKELYLKEDWWAIWLGLGMMIAAILIFEGGGSGLLKALAINPGGLKWSALGQLGAHFSQNANLYLYQFLFWLVLFGVSTAIMGVPSGQFIPAFIVLYVLSIVMFAIAGWANAAKFNLEAPLVALILGLVIANVFRLPKWMDSAFRVEYYIKLGHRAARGDVPDHAGADRGPGCHRAGDRHLARDLPGDLLRRHASVRARPAARGGDRRRRRGLRRFGVHGDRGVGQREEGASLHVGNAGSWVGARHDPRAAFRFERDGTASGRCRRLDRDLGVRRRCRFRSGEHLRPHGGQ